MAFLRRQGVVLKRFPPGVIEPEIVVSKPPEISRKPNISALGFETNDDMHLPNTDISFDPHASAFRSKVFKSFGKTMLYVQDTKATLNAFLHISSADFLLAVVPTVNQICSKMHIEDLSPIEKKECNHDDVSCQEDHFRDTSMLVENGDYLKCSQSDAIFQVKKNTLHFLRDSVWVSVNIHPNLKDGFYTLNADNF